MRDLLFARNKIGERSVGRSRTHTSPQIGLRFIIDSIDCRIVENAFRGVEKGIVFTSDAFGVKETATHYSALLAGKSDSTPVESARSFSDASLGTEERRAHYSMMASSFFSLGNTERTLVRGNEFDATQIGIEWSGTKLIEDFRIVENAFANCQFAAILIEPEDRVFVLRDQVDTKVRLVEKNRFEIFGTAVRATIGAVRVEANDIRVSQPNFIIADWKVSTDIFATGVFGSNSLARSNEANDIPGMRIYFSEARNSIEKDPTSIDHVTLSTSIEEKVHSKSPPNSGDATSDRLYVMKTLADVQAYNTLVPLANEGFIFTAVVREGFVVNLRGFDNRVIDNRIWSTHPNLAGGVLIHSQSGEMRGNEVLVGRESLVMRSLGGTSGGDARIEGNTLRATGQPSTGGQRFTPFALSIPGLVAGNLAVLGNRFEGSVMIGADPFAAFGLRAAGVLEIPHIPTYYNSLKVDAGILGQLFAAKTSEETSSFSVLFNPEFLRILSQGFLIHDPHKDRPVVQFSDNRVVRGYVAIAQTTAGMSWTEEELAKEGNRALVANVSGNVFDYWARLVGRDLIVVGNHSQRAVQYRVLNNSIRATANIPDSVPF